MTNATRYLVNSVTCPECSAIGAHADSCTDKFKMVTPEGESADHALRWLGFLDKLEGVNLQTLDNLADLGRAAETAQMAIDRRVRQLRDHGTSWADIGRALGVTKQAAQQRYGGEC